MSWLTICLIGYMVGTLQATLIVGLTERNLHRRDKRR